MWLREMVETGAHTQPLDNDEKRRLLQRLIDVFEFERFIEKAYLGQKIFTIEGLDAVVPMLDELVTLAHRNGAEEVVFGMAHRGRLSVLAHNLGRSVESILAEFEGAKQIEAVKAVASIPHGGTGDVKYHYGHQGVYETQRGREDRRPPLPQPQPPRVRQPGGRGRDPLHPVRLRGRRSSSTSRSARCRSCSTATPPSRARASSPRRSTCGR